jgi:Zn-dependent metalloprotease
MPFDDPALEEASAPTGDAAVDAAHLNAGLARNFFASVLGRGGIDAGNGPIMSVAHWGKQLNNAAWNGARLLYGDGDGTMFRPLSLGLDVVAHEYAHGVTQHTSGLVYRDQSGALNESFSDVFGETAEQWAEQGERFGTPQAAREADWLIGEDVYTPRVAGDALRSMRAPGTAHPGDIQPSHMRAFNPTRENNGGVHINSGIPNRAAYLTATQIGSEPLARIWYRALTEHMPATATFRDAASATIVAARELYGDGAAPNAVRDAWRAVGVTPGRSASPKPLEATTGDTLGVSAAPRFETRATRHDFGALHDHAHEGHDLLGIIPPWLADGRVSDAERGALTAPVWRPTTE